MKNKLVCFIKNFNFIIFHCEIFLDVLIVSNWIISPPEGSGSVRGSGGGNAREIKIKKTKKKGRKDVDSDEESQTSSTSL